MKARNKAPLSTRIKNRYRLIIRRNDNLEIRYSLVLTPLNVLLIFSVVFVLFFMLTASLFFYTPLKEYVPGYRALSDPEEQIVLLSKIDSLEQSLRTMRLKSEAVERILKGEPEENALETDTNGQAGASSLNNPYRKEEEALKAEMESIDPMEDPSIIAFKSSARGFLHFHQPLRGLLTDSFNAANQHFAIDIISRKNTAVKATLDGTVVFSGWTPETGHMIIMQHTDDWLSVYKHNALNFKKEGNFVHAGEAIAMVGNSGELTTGPHLHFELWHKGVPMNPRNYLYN